MNKTIVNAALIAFVGASASAAWAAADDGHLFDTRGNVVKSGAGLCWKTSRWTPAMAIDECDPDLVKKEAPPAPAPVAKSVEAPKPAPVAAPPAAPKPCDFTATLSSDETFAYNKAVLTGAAKSKLDKELIGKLGNCGKVRLIVITGHTDRLGTAQYNQKLSEKRADAVRDYLAGKGVDANLLDTMGAGKTQPAQGVAKCADNLPRKKLIECLAPNRRVVIEVKGTAK